MSTNYSNDSLPSQFPDHFFCSESIVVFYLSGTLSFTNTIVLFPLSISVLHLGFQRWKQQRSASSEAAVSFSDFFTYNMAVMELIGISGYTICIYSDQVHGLEVALLGYLIAAFPWSGQMYFPILTCVDRYLAVVHPITYLRLRQVQGIHIRNISAGLVWLQCFGGVGFTYYLFRNDSEYSLAPSSAIMAFLFFFVAFSSFSILCVLTRPRPGETGGSRGRVDQSKKKAIQTIIIIMVVLLFRFGGNLCCSVLSFSPPVSDPVKCIAKAAMGWFNVPSSLVLPLLLLHRAGRVPVCKH